MEHSKITKLSKLRDALKYVQSREADFDEIFVFWDINETLLSSPSGFNLKINKNEDIIQKITRGFSPRDGQQMVNIMRKSYYKYELGNIVLGDTRF